MLQRLENSNRLVAMGDLLCGGYHVHENGARKIGRTTGRVRSVPHSIFEVQSGILMGASQNGGELSYTSCCNQATVSSKLRQTNRFQSLLSPLHSLLAFGRSGLRPSPVQGLRPRNAHSKNTPHPPYAAILAVCLIQVGGGQRVHDEIARMAA